MAQKGQPTTFEERIEIGERYASGQNDAFIAKAMRLSVWTVRKWRRRYQQAGRSGLTMHRGRPPSGALGQFMPDVRQAISEMRTTHPGWGPVTIRTELQEQSSSSIERLPSRARIAAFLRQEGLTRPYQRHSRLPQPKAIAPQLAHEIWQVDAQGVLKIPDLGSVAIINIKDVVSRLLVGSYPCVNKQQPDRRDYQLILRRAFLEWGLPKQISLDHACVFQDNTSASPFPTLLHLWLIALGIEVRFIEHRPPLEHSVIERTHQTVERQAIVGQTFSDSFALHKQLSTRQEFLNQHYPSRSLGGQAPLEAFPQAKFSQRPYRLEQEKQLLDMQRVYDYLAQGRWFRLTSNRGQFFLGNIRYNARLAWFHQTLEITFDPQTRELVCLSEDGQHTLRFPIQGLSKEMLMGELSPLLAVPAYQLELPFSRSVAREVMLSQTMTGTIL